jgi:hypothetical protein
MGSSAMAWVSGGYGGMMFTTSNADAERLHPAAAAGKIVKNHYFC